MLPRRPQALAVHFEGEGEEEEGEVAVPGQGQEEEPVSVPTQETVQVRERKWGGGGEEGQKMEGRGSWCRRHCWEGAERGTGMFPEPSCSCGADPCVCSNIRSPRRHRSSSSSPPRLKERRDEEKKEIKDSKGKERQITGKKAEFGCVNSPLALLDCGQHRNILYSWLILVAAGGEL